MLDKYLNHTEVIRFIKELSQNPKYFKIDIHKETTYGKHIQDALALYLFYDILLKYQMIVDDPYLFDEFLFQVERLYRKIDNFDDIVLGVHKLFIGLVQKILDLHDTTTKENRDKIIRYFYQKYMVDGYFIHGFSTTYEEFLKCRDFIPEEYPNFYPDFQKVERIFHKYKIPGLKKDFSKKEISLTDDFIMGCYYSSVSPSYFYQLLCQGSKENRVYLKLDYSLAIRPLKRFMNNYFISEADRKLIFDVVHEEWNLLHRVPKKISLLLIPKKDVMSNLNIKLKEYLESDMSLEEIIDRILSPKYQDYTYSKSISWKNYHMISLDDFSYPKKIDEKKEEVSHEKVTYTFQNSYGVASFLLLIGSFCITLGVLLTIIMVLRGI